MLHCSLDIARNRCNYYFSFWAIFCPFTTLTAQKSKWKKMKKHLDIIILHMCTKNYDHMMYDSWYGVRWTGGKTDRQTDGRTNRQTDRKSDTQMWMPLLISRFNAITTNANKIKVYWDPWLQLWSKTWIKLNTA